MPLGRKVCKLDGARVDDEVGEASMDGGLPLPKASQLLDCLVLVDVSSSARIE